MHTHPLPVSGRRRREPCQAAGVALLLACAAGCLRQAPPTDGSGTIECTQVDVAALVGGRIERLLPREGARIRAGELVAQLDARDGVLRRDEAAAAVAQAQAQLALLQAGTRSEDVQRAREQVREAQAFARLAEADRKRIQEVFAQQSATARQMDEAQAAADRAAAALAAAEQNLARLASGSRKEELQVAQAAVELAQARLAVTAKAVADCTVTSPLDGIVTTRLREDGEVVAPGAPLLTVSRLDEVWLSVYVPEPRLAQVKLGQAARVRLDGVAQAFTGTVTFVAAEAEFTPRNVQTPDERAKLVYRVKITLPNPQGLFKPGMPAESDLSLPAP